MFSAVFKSSGKRISQTGSRFVLAACLCGLLATEASWAAEGDGPRRPVLRALFPLPVGASPAKRLLAGAADLPQRANSPVIHWRGEGAKDAKRSRKTLYLSSALALSAGVFAYWSKDQADSAYEDYRKAAGQQRQDRQLDRAERYDRISAVGFVAMEVGLLWTTYLVFF